MLGGGQLGRFFIGAAHEMGYRVWVLDPDPNSPAGRLADRHLVAAYDDYAALDQIAGQCAAVSTEFENVPAEVLEYLAKFVPVRPSAKAVAVCQNRIAEKSFMREHGIPHGPFAVVRADDDIAAAADALFPAVLKIARFGYDGKGQARVADRDQALHAFHEFNGEPCVLEKMLELEREISVVLARDADGLVRAFEPGENRHRRGILDVTIVPARVDRRLRDEAVAVAERIARELGYVGTLGVEFFVSGGRLFANEMAPRPHNSGHHTIDACVTSQYEQQVRVLAGLPLGEPRMHSHAVMVNLLGELWFDGGDHHQPQREPDWSLVHREPGARLHLYGKHHARQGRKMGHFTVIGDDAGAVLEAALRARAAVGIDDDDH
ncbi:MAG: 5-(carboxyamino)imidazole ribonucleotide synthase [Rhodocyclaceae bacterium]|nr:5-(carboxyamino)imidazole ribonucleotide synthase [Rhodocyclaceae bacterium]